MGFFRSKMFKLAKSISPDTMLFLNDYGIIMDKYFKQIMDTVHRIGGKHQKADLMKKIAGINDEIYEPKI